MEKKKFKLGLVPKLIIAIIIGILFGQFLPTGFCRFVVTLSGFFSTYLKFIIPLMILAYVTMGIADLSQGAGQLLLITVALAYGSTLLAGTASYLVSSNLFPHFMTSGALDQISATADASLKPYFSLTITPLFDTLSAVVLAFILGLCLSTMKGKEIGNSLYNGMSDFSTIIDKVLHKTIIPLLPLYICGTFTDMTKSGKTFAILGILWKVFLVVILMHFVCIAIQFTVAGSISKKKPLTLIKNQIPGYTTALGTQSSAATIPVNLECAKNDGVSSQIRNFVVPLCANIHMAGSMITITACATAVCLMNQLPISLATVVPFIMTLGVAMVASPGAPGGSIMTALPFLYMVFGTTAGAARIAFLARKMLNGTLKEVRFTLYGSFAKTYHGHGTDRALLGGIMGFGTDDMRIRDSFEIAKGLGLDFTFVPNETETDVHPNTVDIFMTNEHGDQITIRGESLGGGKARICRINDVEVDFTGEYSTVIVIQKDKPGVVTYITKCLSDQNVNIVFMRLFRESKRNTAYTIVESDGCLPENIADEIKKSPNVSDVMIIQL
ncbi:L-serine dehydratase%2C beta chain [uncultured Eubacterium sp.]|nr:L-serine dehydratase%2C beta chain [uncultured Eubacterium sp.]